MDVRLRFVHDALDVGAAASDDVRMVRVGYVDFHDNPYALIQSVSLPVLVQLHILLIFDSGHLHKKFFDRQQKVSYLIQKKN